MKETYEAWAVEMRIGNVRVFARDHDRPHVWPTRESADGYALSAKKTLAEIGKDSDARPVRVRVTVEAV